MAIYLDEDMVGEDANEICYPRLLLCMGVTLLMTDGSLIGGHFTIPETETDLANEMVARVNAHPAAMHHLYCTADLPEHTATHGGLDVVGKANLLGFHGDAYSLDTSAIKPQHGVFVAVRSNGPNQRCGVYYKRDEKVDALYQYGQGANVSKIQAAKPWRAAQVLNLHSVTTGLSGPIHKLHKASFLLEIKHYNIP